MADFWLEKELARQLAPVKAPESLWDRIHGRQGGVRRRVSQGWVFWAAAAIVVLAVTGIAHYRGEDNDPDKFADHELALRAHHAGFDYRSDNFEDTRAWVKARANIDIDVPSGRPAEARGEVHLVGVRMVELRGLPIAAIDYRVGEEAATLFVSGKRPGVTGNMEASKHLYSPRGFSSWNMRSETYTIAFSSAKNPHGACLLCHATRD